MSVFFPIFNFQPGWCGVVGHDWFQEAVTGSAQFGDWSCDRCGRSLNTGHMEHAKPGRFRKANK